LFGGRFDTTGLRNALIVYSTLGVLEVHSRGLVVLVVAEPTHEGRLRRDAQQWTDEAGFNIAADEVEKVYVWPDGSRG
jgi:hypothetical protein